MKKIERYVLGAFLSSFVLSFLVLTFVMTIGLMVQIVMYILDGVPAKLVGEFAMVSFPETLQWTMPLALLVSSVLVFSRMSADSEIAAMRACGINLLTVMKYPVIFASICTVIGIYINNEIVPRGHEVRRSLKSKVTVGTGLEVLEPGRWISDFPKAKLYFGSKSGNWLHDLIVIDYSSPKVERMITATKALVTSENRDIKFDLYNMTVDPLDADHPQMARANRFQYVVRNALKNTTYTKRTKDLRTFEIFDKIKEIDGIYSTLNNAKTDDEKNPAVISDAKNPDVAKPAPANQVQAPKPAAKPAMANKVPAANGVQMPEMSEAERRAAHLKRTLEVKSELKVEFSKRLVFAFASICFVLVGIPLGIKAQRRESTIGMAISLIISLGYYMIIMLMLSLESHYAIYPHLLIWLPVLICLILASRLIPRNT